MYIFIYRASGLRAPLTLANPPRPLSINFISQVETFKKQKKTKYKTCKCSDSDERVLTVFHFFRFPNSHSNDNNNILKKRYSLSRSLSKRPLPSP